MWECYGNKERNQQLVLLEVTQLLLNVFSMTKKCRGFHPAPAAPAVYRFTRRTKLFQDLIKNKTLYSRGGRPDAYFLTDVGQTLNRFLKAESVTEYKV